jgi:hypothetical protein
VHILVKLFDPPVWQNITTKPEPAACLMTASMFLNPLPAIGTETVELGDVLTAYAEKNMVINPFPQRADTFRAINICACVCHRSENSATWFRPERHRKIQIKGGR